MCVDGNIKWKRVEVAAKKAMPVLEGEQGAELHALRASDIMRASNLGRRVCDEVKRTKSPLSSGVNKCVVIGVRCRLSERPRVSNRLRSMSSEGRPGRE
eukprot:10298472-Alexandrium_andersonii.AAC.1